MGKKAQKKKKTKTTNYDSFVTKWSNNSIPAGRLDVVYSYKDAIDTLSDVEAYFYVKEYDDLVVVEIDEEKKTIDVSKRSTAVFPTAVKNNLITLIGHLPVGLNILSVYNNKVTLLSSNHDEYDKSWEKGFSYFPPGFIFTEEYLPKHVLLRLVKYVDSKQSEEAFVLIEKERAIIATILQEIKGTLLYDKTNLLEDGIKGFIDTVCAIKGCSKTLKNVASEQIFKGIKDGTITGRMQRATTKDRKAEIYSSLLDNYNATRLMDVVTNPVSKNKALKEEEEISALAIIREEYKKGNSKSKKESLQKILNLGKVPDGFGLVEIDVEPTFYPKVMKKIESIFFTSNVLLVNIPEEKGINADNVADIFELNEKDISVYHAREER